jgi:hypothetical protein
MAIPLCRALRRTAPIKPRGSFTVNTAFCSGIGTGAVACWASWM